MLVVVLCVVVIIVVVGGVVVVVVVVVVCGVCCVLCVVCCVLCVCVTMGDPGAQLQMIGLLDCFLSLSHTLSLTSHLLVPFSPTSLLLSGSSISDYFLSLISFPMAGPLSACLFHFSEVKFFIRHFPDIT